MLLATLEMSERENEKEKEKEKERTYRTGAVNGFQG